MGGDFGREGLLGEHGRGGGSVFVNNTGSGYPAQSIIHHAHRVHNETNNVIPRVPLVASAELVLCGHTFVHWVLVPTDHVLGTTGSSRGARVQPLAFEHLAKGFIWKPSRRGHGTRIRREVPQSIVSRVLKRACWTSHCSVGTREWFFWGGAVWGPYSNRTIAPFSSNVMLAK